MDDPLCGERCCLLGTGVVWSDVLMSNAHCIMKTDFENGQYLYFLGVPSIKGAIMTYVWFRNIIVIYVMRTVNDLCRVQTYKLQGQANEKRQQHTV